VIGEVTVLYAPQYSTVTKLCTVGYASVTMLSPVNGRFCVDELCAVTKLYSDSCHCH